MVFSEGHEKSSPKNLLEHVEKKYNKINTYYDKGRIFTTHAELKFQTYYKSKNLFIFEWIAINRAYKNIFHYSICSNDKGVYTYEKDGSSTKGKIEKTDSLRSAIVQYVGVSKGGISIIPRFFF